MPIAASDIQYKHSGGASNSDPNADLGGVISSVSVTDNTLHNIFDKVLGDESLAGDIEYRGIYTKNNHSSLTLEASVIWIEQNTAGNKISIGLAAEAVGSTMATIANESTAPTGVTFSQPATKAAGLAIGDIPAGSSKGIWIKRTIPAAEPAANNVTFILKTEGDTAA